MWKFFGVMVFFSFCFSFIEAQNFNGFENFPSGHEYTLDSWNTDGFDPRWVNGFNQSRAYIDDAFSVSGENSLRVSFPEDGVGPANSGAQAPLRLEPQDEYYVSYWLRFSDNFSWGTSSYGGKLPGLGGGDNCSGCSICTGDNGFSARLMWRADGRAVLYLYDMDKEGNCGADYNLQWENGEVVHFEKGRWYNIIERVKINTEENNDGEVELWINNEQALLVENLKFVTNGDKIDNFYFSTFHGGADPGWAPGVDCYIWFDDISISAFPEDVFPPECLKPELGDNVSFCGTEGNITLSTNLSEEDRFFNWFKDGEPLEGNTSNLSISLPGEYKVIVDSLGCVREDSITVLNTIPINELSSINTLCDPSEILLDSKLDSEQYNFEWYKNGNVIEGETGNSLLVSSAGDYEVIVQAGECEEISISKTVFSKLPETVDDCLPEPGIASLKVLPLNPDAGLFFWYNRPVGGNPEHEGKEFSPFVSENTFYYVQDMNQQIYYTGKIERGGTVWNISDFDSDDKKMRIVVTQKLTIDSVTVYASDNQTLVVRVLKNGEVLRQVSIDVSAGKVKVPLEVTLEPGEYIMDAEGSTGRIVYEAEGGGLPYIIDDILELTGNAAWVMTNDRYPLFYNFRISVGNNCSRIRVTANVGSCSEPQPVELGDFKGEYRNGNVLLNWITFSEKNVHKFHVMKSEDGVNFHGIGSVDAIGNSDEIQNYVFTDYNFSVPAYYNLVFKDFDGSTEESKIIFVGDFYPKVPVVFPNPFNNNFQIRGSENRNFVISDLTGRVQIEGNVFGNQYYGSGLEPGAFLLTIYGKSGKQTIKLLKVSK